MQESVDSTAKEIRSESHSLLDHRLGLLASGVCLWWIFAIFSSDVFPFAAYEPSHPHVAKLCIIAAAIITLAVCRKCRSKLTPFALKPWALPAISVAASIATLVFAIAQIIPLVPVALCAAGVVIGACGGYLATCWGIMYSSQRLERITVIAFLSVAVGAAPLWLESFIPAQEIRSLIVVFLPLVNLVSFRNIKSIPPAEETSIESNPKWAKICIFLPPLHGLFMGLLAGIGLANSNWQINSLTSDYALAITLVFLMLAVAAAAVLHVLKLNVLHRPVIILLAPALMMIPFLLESNRWNAGFWSICAVLLFLTILWIATSDIANVLKIDPFGFFALRYSAALLGLAVGVFLSFSLVNLVSIESPLVSATIAVVIFAHVISSVITMEDQQAMEETFESKIASPPAENVSVQTVCETLAEKHALTPRELEVLQLLAQGRDPSRIQETLVVSYHTVRNHIKSIYKKLGVHSRQELIDALEKETEDLELANSSKK